jgi:hypothetical protein
MPGALADEGRGWTRSRKVELVQSAIYCFDGFERAAARASSTT